MSKPLSDLPINGVPGVRRNIRIAVPGLFDDSPDTEVVQAVVYRRWAIHETLYRPFGPMTVTHVPSGRAVVTDLTQRSARALVGKLLRLPKNRLMREEILPLVAPHMGLKADTVRRKMATDALKRQAR